MTCIVVKFLRTLRTQSTLIPWLQRHLVPPTKDSLTKCLLGERLPRSHKKTIKVTSSYPVESLGLKPAWVMSRVSAP